MNRRLSILKHWFSNKRNNVTFFNLLTKVIEPTCSQKASKIITNIEKEGAFLKVFLKGFEEPLYYPANMKLISLHQVIAESFYKSDWHYYEVAQTKVTSKDTVVDCGAAEGMFTYLTSSRCKKVYAIEPLKNFIDSMDLSFENKNNIEVLPYALSDISGTANINSSDISSSINYTTNDSESKDIVKLKTLDELFFEKGIDITYLKADLEGFETKMLKGGQNLLKKCKPKIAITTYHKPEHVHEISEIIKSVDNNYNILIKGIELNWGAPVMLHAWM